MVHAWHACSMFIVVYMSFLAMLPPTLLIKITACFPVPTWHLSIFLWACSCHGQAAALYKATGAHGRLAAVLFADDNWAGLVQLSAELTRGDPLLLRVGAWLQSAGLAPEAAAAFARARLRA